MNASPTVDPARAEIVRNALVSAAREMHDTLVRSAYNPLIFDVKDFGVTIISATGDLWADAPGLPVFVTSLPETVRSGIRHWQEVGFSDGDVLIANSPYLTGTHLSDTSVYMPVFYDGKLVAFAATMAHWADIGGMSPGGWTVASTEIFQEGLVFTHQRLYIGGEPNVDLLEFIESNVRSSDIVMGDLRAQMATCLTGARRVQELCARYGDEEVCAVMADVIDKTRRALRHRISEFPDGVVSRSHQLDFDGVERGARPTIALSLSIEGDQVEVNFEGTSQAALGPINQGAAATLSSVNGALKGFLDPLGATNEAHLSVIDVSWPEVPSLVNPAKPSPCDSYGYVGTAIVEMLIHALSEFVPDAGRASSYQMYSDYILCTSSRNRRFVFAEPVMGGHGGFPGHDGGTFVFTGDGDTLNTPVEVLEKRFPVRCERFSFNEGSEGSGEFRGGMGVVRDLRVLQDDCMIKTALESTTDDLALGLFGGTAGHSCHTVLLYPDGKEDDQYERVGDYPVPQGLVMSIRTGGGGGFGDPLDRDPERVASDVQNEFITEEDAWQTYAVRARADSHGNVVIDYEATKSERDRRKEEQRVR